MVRTERAIGTTPTISLRMALVSSLMIGGVTRADNLAAQLDSVTSQSIDLQSSSIAMPATQPNPIKPLRLTLTQAELQAIIARYEKYSGHTMYGLEEITVTAPAELLPMRDTTQEVWGGIAAPLWAVLHPTQAWRIFLPIPPE